MVNVGTLLRDSGTVANLALGTQLTYGFGGRVPFIPGQLDGIAELNGALTVSGDEVDAGDNPMELLGGVQLQLNDIRLTGGLGSGLVNGYGSPDFHVIFGVSFSPAPMVPGHRGARRRWLPRPRGRLS